MAVAGSAGGIAGCSQSEPPAETVTVNVTNYGVQVFEVDLEVRTDSGTLVHDDTLTVNPDESPNPVTVSAEQFTVAVDIESRGRPDYDTTEQTRQGIDSSPDDQRTPTPVTASRDATFAKCENDELTVELGRNEPIGFRYTCGV
jgi:hypothetical protein